MQIPQDLIETAALKLKSVKSEAEFFQLRARYLGKKSFVVTAFSKLRDLKSDEKVDVRYLRENAKKVCDVSLSSNKVYAYAPKDHSISESLGNRFSVYQDIYSLEKFYEKINTDKKFPPIETLLSSEIIAYKIKYNITEMMFYSPNEENKLRRLYKFNEYLENKVTKALIVCQGSGSESAVYIEH